MEWDVPAKLIRDKKDDNFVVEIFWPSNAGPEFVRQLTNPAIKSEKASHVSNKTSHAKESPKRTPIKSPRRSATLLEQPIAQSRRTSVHGPLKVGTSKEQEQNKRLNGTNFKQRPVSGTKSFNKKPSESFTRSFKESKVIPRAPSMNKSRTLSGILPIGRSPTPIMSADLDLGPIPQSRTVSKSAGVDIGRTFKPSPRGSLQAALQKARSSHGADPLEKELSKILGPPYPKQVSVEGVFEDVPSPASTPSNPPLENMTLIVSPKRGSSHLGRSKSDTERPATMGLMQPRKYVRRERHRPPIRELPKLSTMKTRRMFSASQLPNRPYYHYELPTVSSLAQSESPELFKPPAISYTERYAHIHPTRPTYSSTDETEEDQDDEGEDQEDYGNEQEYEYRQSDV